MAIVRDKFDFEIGYLIKSPCKTCDQRDLFPNCTDTCLLLDRIQTLLARGITCSRTLTAVDAGALCYQAGNRKLL